MPDDQKELEQVPDDNKPQQPSADTSEKQQLRAESTRKLQAYSQLSKLAADKGYDTPEEMIRDLDIENAKLSGMIEAASQYREPQQPKPAPEPKKEREPIVDTEARATALRVTMTNDWRDFKRQHSDLDVSKKELDEILSDPIMQVAIARKYHQQLTNDDDANFYDLAFTAFKLIRDETQKKKKEDASTDDVDASELTANLVKGQPPEGGKKPDEKQQFVDDLIPDDAPL